MTHCHNDPLVFFRVLDHVEHCKVALFVSPKGPTKQTIPSKGQKGWSKGSRAHQMFDVANWCKMCIKIVLYCYRGLVINLEFCPLICTSTIFNTTQTTNQDGIKWQSLGKYSIETCV